jgi:hypothetical protein
MLKGFKVLNNTPFTPRNEMNVKGFKKPNKPVVKKGTNIKNVTTIREIEVLGNKYRLDSGKFPQLFYEMVNRIVADSLKGRPEIKVSFREESQQKKDNGIVLIALTLTNEDINRAVTINFLYSEDRRIIDKKKSLETIVESINVSVINPNLCKVLFNIHGSQSIDKSAKYINRIVNDNMCYVSGTEKK